jgi:hypothetical protein
LHGPFLELDRRPIAVAEEMRDGFETVLPGGGQLAVDSDRQLAVADLGA